MRSDLTRDYFHAFCALDRPEKLVSTFFPWVPYTATLYLPVTVARALAERAGSVTDYVSPYCADCRDTNACFRARECLSVVEP